VLVRAWQNIVLVIAVKFELLLKKSLTNIKTKTMYAKIRVALVVCFSILLMR